MSAMHTLWRLVYATLAVFTAVLLIAHLSASGQDTLSTQVLRLQIGRAHV